MKNNKFVDFVVLCFGLKLFAAFKVSLVLGIRPTVGVALWVISKAQEVFPVLGSSQFEDDGGYLPEVKDVFVLGIFVKPGLVDAYVVEIVVGYLLYVNAGEKSFYVKEANDLVCSFEDYPDFVIVFHEVSGNAFAAFVFLLAGTDLVPEVLWKGDGYVHFSLEAVRIAKG